MTTVDTFASVTAERDRLRESIRRIFRDRREADKITAECLSVMPELVSTARADKATRESS